MGALAIAVAAIANRIPFAGRGVKHEALAAMMAAYEPDAEPEGDDGREG